MNNKGIALLLSLIIMVILLVLGGAYMYMVRLEAYISKNQRDSTDALYIAEAGMERGIRNFVELKGDWPIGTTLGPEYLDLDGGQTKKYTVTSGTSSLGTDWRLLTSTGIIREPGTLVNLAERRLQADVSIVAFKYALLADHDINRSTASGRVNGRVHANGVCYLPASMLDSGQPEPSMPAVSMPEIDMSYDSSGNPSSTNYYANSANFPTVTHSLVPGDMSFVGAYSNPTVYYIQGIATIYVTDQDTSFTNCILVAEGTIATTTVDTVSPYNTVTVNDTVGFTYSGKAVINGEYFTYTGKTGTTFTGCSGITTDHFTGETVIQVNSSLLQADVLGGSSSITLNDTTGFSYPAGSAFISQEANLEGESFTYKNITGNTLNGCTGIDSNYTVGARVIQHGDSIVIKGNELIQDGNYSITGSGPVKNIVTFNVRNIGLGDVVIDRFGASWTPTDSVQLNSIDIGTKSWTGLTYTSGAPPIDLIPDSDSISSSAITTVRLTFNADMRSRSIKVDFYEVRGELYTFTLINPPPGPKSFSFSVMKDPNDASRTIYPALATKFGNIVEGSSTDRSQVQISGVVFSEQGRIQFDHTNLTGAIVASEMDLINSNSAGFGITVNYGTKSTVPDPAPEGFTGGLTIINWREVY